VAYFGPRLRRRDRTCRDSRTASADSYRVNVALKVDQMTAVFLRRPSGKSHSAFSATLVAQAF
jgi:hypothetical protein